MSQSEVEILIVDDNPADVELIRRGLQKHNLANKFFVVRDGAEALEYIFTTGAYADRNIDDIPKLILLDLNLPGMSGLEVLRKIKSHEKTKTIPVVLLTASTDERDIEESRKLGVDNYVVKPVDFGEFVETVGNLVYYWLLRNDLKILILEDVANDVILMEKELYKEGLSFLSKRVDTKEAFLKEVRDFKPDIILIDYKLPHFDGKSALRLMKECAPSIPGIVVTGVLGDEEAVESMKAGAVDYVLKDRLSRLGTTVKRALELKKTREEKEKAEKELQKSEKMLKSIFDSSPEAIAVLDITTNIRDCNNEALKLYGFSSKAELIGKNALDFITPNDRQRVFEDMEKTLKQGFIKNIEYISLDKNGNEFPIEISASVIRDFSGKPALFVVNIVDITERKQSEKALRESQNKYRTLVENLPQKIFLKNKDSVYVSCNENYARDLKITPDAIAGKTDYDFFPKELADKYRTDDKRIMTNGKTDEIEEKYVKDGQEIFVQTVKTPVKDENGNVIGILGIFWDITEKKQMEQILLHSEKMASIGSLAAGIAHEINNPIAYIDSNLKAIKKNVKKVSNFYDFTKSLLKDHSETDASKNKELITTWMESSKKMNIEYLLTDTGNAIDESLEGTEKVKRIVADLRDFSRSEKPAMTIENINEAIEKTLNVIWNELKYKADVIKELGSLPDIECDIHKLSQVFLNLLVNAAQAIEKKGIIKIKTFSKDNFVFIQMSDTGAGIPPENLTKIFDAFFTTKDPGKGTGLGLSIAYKIIQEHKGTITVQSDVGKGTTFIIKLPINKSILAEERKILIVDDDKMIRELLKETIGKYDPSIVVNLAKDGFEAADLLHSFSFNVVLLDINMPGIDGFEVCKKIKSDEITKNTKVIMISGLPDTDLRKKSLEVGAIEFLQKPIQSRTFYQVLDKIFKQ